MPCYDEIVHLPLFIHDSRFPETDGQSRSELVQTIDPAASLLEFFGISSTPDMQGKAVRPVIEANKQIRDYVLFGIHGAHVNVSDGQYVYMKVPDTADNTPPNEYTLMPMHMRNLFNIEELRAARFVEEGFSVTKGCPVLQISKTDSSNGDFSDILVHGKNSETERHIDNNSLVNAANFGDKLFALAADFKQEYELQTFELEARIANLLVRAMKENDSPQEQFARLGLPMERTIIAEDIRKMHQRADRRPPRNPDR